MRNVNWLVATGLAVWVGGCVGGYGYPTTSYGGYRYSNGYYAQPTYYRSTPTYYYRRVVTQPRYIRVGAPRYHRHRDRDRDGIPNRYDRDKNGDGVPDRRRWRW